MIETILVIALLAAAAATSSVLIDSEWISRRSVTAVTNDVANTLTTARNTAITKQANVGVRRQRSRGMEQLVITEEANALRDEQSWVVELGNDVRLAGPRRIRFSPTGTADRSIRWTVRRSRSIGTVEVAPASGQVSRRLP